MPNHKALEALLRAGGPERLASEAADRAARLERERWLEILEREPAARDEKTALLFAGYVRSLRRRLGIGQPQTTVRAQTRGRVQRLRALGDWGEQ
jgi:hypothetical protein